MAFSIYTVTEQEAALTVRDFLKAHHISARQIQKLTRLKGILLNGRPAYLKASLRAGDVVKIRQTQPPQTNIQPEDLPVDILYEDEFLFILNKPPRQLVHPTGQTTSGTLANALAHHLQKQQQPIRFYPLHRLDRDTSGCVVFAKSPEAQRKLEKQRDTHILTRTYQALVHGIPTKQEGTIRLPIGAHPTLANRRTVRDDGDPAVTHYRALTTYDKASLLELTLETGRTHQIRIHLAAIALPILGDAMYGVRSVFIKRQALHAAALSFRHLKTDQPITVHAPLPQDMVSAISLCQN